MSPHSLSSAAQDNRHVRVCARLHLYKGSSISERWRWRPSSGALVSKVSSDVRPVESSLVKWNTGRVNTLHSSWTEAGNDSSLKNTKDWAVAYKLTLRSSNHATGSREVWGFPSFFVSLKAFCGTCLSHLQDENMTSICLFTSLLGCWNLLFFIFLVFLKWANFMPRMRFSNSSKCCKLLVLKSENTRELLFVFIFSAVIIEKHF